MKNHFYIKGWALNLFFQKTVADSFIVASNKMFFVEGFNFQQVLWGHKYCLLNYRV